jgi:sugar diacid utilization regulator
VQQLQDYQRALSQARQALDLSDTLRPAQRITDYQQLGFIKLLSAIGDPALLSDFMHDTLGCLIERDRKSPWLLMETLETCSRRTATWSGPPSGLAFTATRYINASSASKS